MIAKRFAAKGATAAQLSAADGPLLVSDLVTSVMALWTVVQIIRVSVLLWSDAASLARQEA
ncbi:MAG TPA: hypothetical protein VM884_05750 [Flavisolibacter sp.]|nr:hypothetical protein [Flavisolibacter sp.]